MHEPTTPIRLLAALLVLVAAVACGKRDAAPLPAATSDRPFPPLTGPGRDGWSDRQPLQWRKTPVQRRAFSYEVDREIFHGGAQSARLSGTSLASGDVASLSQTIDAAALRGRRVVVRAWTRQTGIGQWAHMWVVVRDATQRSLAAGRVPEPAERGDLDWRELTVELEVPVEAATLSVGFVLLGSGTLWIDDVSVADATGAVMAPRLSNPDFEEVASDDD